MEPRLVKVDFRAMLRSDCKIVCDHFTLNNSKRKWGIDFTEPMLFDDFLRLIGTNLTPMNCKSLFHDAEWYIWTDDSDELINEYFIKEREPSKLFRIDVHCEGRHIYVSVTSSLTNDKIDDKYVTIPSEYTYTFVDKYIRKITIEEKVNQIIKQHEIFWNGRE